MPAKTPELEVGDIYPHYDKYNVAENPPDSVNSNPTEESFRYLSKFCQS